VLEEVPANFTLQIAWEAGVTGADVAASLAAVSEVLEVQKLYAQVSRALWEISLLAHASCALVLCHSFLLVAVMSRCHLLDHMCDSSCCDVATPHLGSQVAFLNPRTWRLAARHHCNRVEMFCSCKEMREG